MKLLPRKQIDQALQAEKKSQIDQGRELSLQIEEIRHIRQSEEQSLQDFRNGRLAQVKVEIQTLDNDKATLEQEIAELTAHRTKLLIPLTEEWQSIKDTQEYIEQQKTTLSIETQNTIDFQESVKAEAKALETKRKTVIKKEQEAYKLFASAEQSKEVADSLESMKRYEYEVQQQEYGLRLQEIDEMKLSYENGLAITEKEAIRLNEREQELNDREKLINDKYETLQRTINRLK